MRFIVPSATPLYVAVTPDGTKAYVSNYESEGMSVIDTGTHAVVSTVIVGHSAKDLEVTPNGTRLYQAKFDSSAAGVYDTSTDAIVDAVLDLGKGPTAVAITSTGKLYVTNATSKRCVRGRHGDQ